MCLAAAKAMAAATLGVLACGKEQPPCGVMLTLLAGRRQRSRSRAESPCRHADRDVIETRQCPVTVDGAPDREQHGLCGERVDAYPRGDWMQQETSGTDQNRPGVDSTSFR